MSISVNYQSYMDNSCTLFFCFNGVDTKTTVTFTAAGVAATIAAGTTPGIYDLTVKLPSVATKPTDVSVTISVVNTDNGFFDTYSSSGYIDIDNLRAGCN